MICIMKTSPGTYDYELRAQIRMRRLIYSRGQPFGALEGRLQKQTTFNTEEGLQRFSKNSIWTCCLVHTIQP